MHPVDPELFESMSSTNAYVHAAAADLQAVFGKPTLNPSPDGDGPWSAYQWFFSVDGDMLGAITKHEGGAERWKIWSVRPGLCRKVLDAVVDHMREAGYPVSI